MLKDLFFELLDNADQRKLQILDCLSKRKNVAKITYLSEELKIARATLFKDIKYLNVNFKKELKLKIVDNSIHLHMHSDESIMEAKETFFRNSQCIELLSLLIEDSYSNIQLTYKLHISQALLYNYIIRIKEGLSKYKLDVSRGSLTITGEEKVIRNIHYLICKFNNTNNLSSKYIDISGLFEEQGFKISPESFMNLQYYLHTMKVRGRLKQYISVPPKIRRYVTESYLYLKLSKVFFPYLQKQGFYLEKDEVVFLCIFLMNNTSFALEELPEVRVEKPYFFDLVSDLIVQVDKQLSLQLSSNKEFIDLIANFIMLRYPIMKYISNNLLFDESAEQLQSKNTPNQIIYNTYKEIEGVFISWGEQNDIKYIRTVDIIHCAIYIEAFKVKMNCNKRYTVAVCISQGYEWEYYLKILLGKMFLNDISIITLSYEEINNKLLKNVDMLILDKKSKIDVHEDIEVIHIDELLNTPIITMSAVQ